MPFNEFSNDSEPITEAMTIQLDDDALPIGSVVGGCQILELISRDALGNVYTGHDPKRQCHVLIREHFPQEGLCRVEGMQVSLREGADAAVCAHALQSFLQEARLLESLRHPSIGKVNLYWEENGTAYMKMPFYQGETLASVLRRHGERPSEAWLGRVLTSLLEALGVLHGANCFHLAISPEKIWMTPEGLPVLLDLAASNKVAGDHRLDSNDGLDRSYAAIEQFSHGAALPIGPWTDLYALGAVMHHAILGRPPTCAAILSEEDRLAPLAESLGSRGSQSTYSPTFLAAIDRALAVSPSDRPQSAAELMALLKASAPSPARQHQRKPEIPSNQAEPAHAVEPAMSSQPRAGVQASNRSWSDISMQRVLLREDSPATAPIRAASINAGRSSARWWSVAAASVVMSLGAAAWYFGSSDATDTVLAVPSVPAVAAPASQVVVFNDPFEGDLEPTLEVPKPEVPAEADSSVSPPAALVLPEPAPKAAAVAAPASPTTPRAVCANRSNFSLVYCMQTQCKRPGFSQHPQCIEFRTQEAE